MDAKQDTWKAHLSDTLRSQLEQSLETCDLLEALADELPRKNLAVWRAAMRQCQDVLRDHVAVGRDTVMPVLIARLQPDFDMNNVLRRFLLDYETMADRIDDLEDILSSAVSSQQNSIGSEALGYALRSHFDLIRKQIGWERDVLLPMLQGPQPANGSAQS